jgi:hypothetical protein
MVSSYVSSSYVSSSYVSSSYVSHSQSTSLLSSLHAVCPYPCSDASSGLETLSIDHLRETIAWQDMDRKQSRRTISTRGVIGTESVSMEVTPKIEKGF